MVRRVRVGEHGAFKLGLRTRRPPGLGSSRLHPDAGYTARWKTKKRKLALPYLGMGSNGPSVRALERLLNQRQYALRGVGRITATTPRRRCSRSRKVHGLSRTGRTTPDVWRRLTRSKTPRARVPKGNHIEISKTHQVIYEVRKGKVVNVIHLDGATGNTPVGRWRVYSKVPGYNASHMYYSLFFLRGFAIHGYHSVPPWPASHGCSRIPLWIAPASTRAGATARGSSSSPDSRPGAVYPQRMDDASSDPVVRQIRDQISDNDRALVEALNKRLQLVARLWEYKAARLPGAEPRA